jgi:hypothetical protein
VFVGVDVLVGVAVSVGMSFGVAVVRWRVLVDSWVGVFVGVGVQSLGFSTLQWQPGHLSELAGLRTSRRRDRAR